VNVFVDTSVWSLAFRRRSQDLSTTEAAIVRELSELIKEGRTRMIGPVRQELLSGIQTTEQFDKLCSIMQPFLDEPLTSADYEDAAKASNECRRKGLAVSIVDALICSVGISRGWAVFTTDPDFVNYSKILPLKLHKPRS
jgi:predicted nucleic acid-binding protein